MRRPSVFVAWSLTATIALGVPIAWWDDSQALRTAYILVGSAVLLVAALSAARRGGDPLNPLTWLIAVEIARLLIPWLEIRYAGATNPTFQAMSIRMTDWNAGASFAVLGLLCIALIWSCIRSAD